MADVTGPINSLPGSHHYCPDSTMCDMCKVAAASVRIQGETDSMGSEMHDYCLACYNKHKQQDLGVSGECDWCHLQADQLSATRDMDEGMCGPVYYVCAECKRKQREQDLAEYNAMQSEYDIYLSSEDDTLY